MANLTPISAFTGSIQCEEITKAMSGANAGVADGALNAAYMEQFKIRNSNCLPTDLVQVRCLYLYLYALQSFDSTGDNFINEQQLMALLSKVEQLSKSCCCNE